jgi:hypothetical protein
MPDSIIATVNGVGIEKDKADELLRWLIFTEKNNAKTKAKNDQQMVVAIQKKIEEVLQCY